MSRTPTRLGVVGTALNLIGLGLAIYLTVEHFSSTPTFACPETSTVNCLKVTTSSYAEFAGFPVALAGVIYFVVSFPLHLPIAWRSVSSVVRGARWAWAVIGMISVFWLVYGELEVGAICPYCTGVHLVTFGLFALTVLGSAALSDTSGTAGRAEDDVTAVTSGAGDP